MIGALLTNCAASVLLAASPAPLADVFVDQTNGNCGAADGSAGAPYCTIAAAIANAAPADVIRIAPGTYVENVVVGFDLSLVGTSGAEVTILDGGANGSVVTIPASVDVTLDGLTITNGRGHYGGGINVEGDLTLANSKVIGNRAVGDQGGPAPDWGGGGIGSINGGGPMPMAVVPHITIVNSTIRDNVADFNDPNAVLAGGGVYVRFGELRVSGSTISGNSDRVAAGGIHVARGYLAMENSTVSGNLSKRGGVGGISLGQLPSAGGANCRFESVTITENLAPLGYAGGIAADTAFPFPVPGNLIVLRNSAIAGNVAGARDDYGDVNGEFDSQGHNLIGALGFSYTTGLVNGVNGDQVGTSAFPIDPLLHPLQDNGGTTETHLPMAGSPLIDTGDAAMFLATDQRGTPRPVGGAPDVGAVEFVAELDELCTGDGGVSPGCTSCPCGNDATAGTVGGCLNSAATSARLTASGDPSLSLPAGSTTDLRFALTGGVPSALAVLTSGDSVAPVNPSNPCFGLGSGVTSAEFDGLRCAVGGVRRHGGRSIDAAGDVGATTSPWGGEGAPAAGLGASAGFAAGQVRIFQVVHRDDPAMVCMRGLNTTQALQVLFTP